MWQFLRTFLVALGEMVSWPVALKVLGFLTNVQITGDKK